MYGADKIMVGAQQAQGLDAAREYSNAGFVNEAKRESEIPSALNRLESRLLELQDAIHTLESRLTGSVARSCPPVQATVGQQIRATMQTGIGGQLDSMQERAQNACLQLRDLIDRLEV